MNTKSTFERAIPVLVAGVGIAALAVWFFLGTDKRFEQRLPGADLAPGQTSVSENGASVWKGKFARSNGVPAALTGVWGQFRGNNRDGISTENIPFLKTWPTNGPAALWKIGVGEGFAGGVIWKGRVFVLDYDAQAKADVLRVLSLTDGREIWQYSYPDKVKRNHGMSRTVPTVTDTYCLTLGPKCNVLCLDPNNGDFKWQIDMVSEFGTEVPPWYAGQCPFVDGDKLILGTGGKDALVVAVDVKTGKVLWKSPNPNHWAMTHSSVVPMNYKGKRMYLYCAGGGLVAVSADDGKTLFEFPDWKISIANIPSPLVIGEDRIFLSGGYNAGSMMLKVGETNGKLEVKTLFRLGASVFGATQHTPILYKNHIIGVRPDGQLICLDFDGKIKWQSGPANKFGGGPYIIVQDMILLMNDDGLLTLAEASLTGYKQLAQARVLEGPDAWAPMALADGHLVLRDVNQMICLDVRAK